MKLFVANCTNQMQSVNYRLVEGPGRGYSTQNVDVGRQAMIGHPNLNRPQIDSILDQLAIFGLRMAKDIDWSDKTWPVPLVATVDDPVPAETMQRMHARNADIMRDAGAKLRREAAIATSHGMRGYSPQAADNVALSVEEEKPGTMDHGGDRGIAEGYRMDRDFGQS